MRYIDVTCVRSFLRLNVKADRVFPIPPMIINKQPIIRTDHLSKGNRCSLEIVVINEDVLAIFDIYVEEILNAADVNNSV